MSAIDDPSSQRFFHGTKADLKLGDLIEPGRSSNYGKKKKAVYVYLTATLDAATWGAELAIGDHIRRSSTCVVRAFYYGTVRRNPFFSDRLKVSRE